MLEVSNINTYGFEAAIRAMRNPKNSWNLSDTTYINNEVKLGEKDLTLMKKLIKAGPDHRKFLRQIIISLDIKAPLYFLKEFDTYKVGTVSNSCSTMHKIQDKAFELSDFSTEWLDERDSLNLMKNAVYLLNVYRDLFNETHDKHFWWQMIQLLPSSYNQLRTITMNYEVAYRMYFARKDHKLDEWHTLCDAFKNELPYFKEFIDN